MNRVREIDTATGFELVNPGGEARAILTCDHAGNYVPPSFDALGLSPSQLTQHIAWDIGAAEVTRRLATNLDAPAILATHSRLFVDPNRKLGSPESIIKVSDGIEIPGNQNVTPEEATLRAELAFWPYHHEIEKALVLAEHRVGVVAQIAVHSFTPVMAGYERPWHIGVLYDRDERLARPLLEALGADDATCVGDNQPYSATHPPGYGFEAYGTSAGRPHVMIEIRQDLIDTEAGAAAWADRLSEALSGLLADETVFSRQYFR